MARCLDHPWGSLSRDGGRMGFTSRFRVLGLPTGKGEQGVARSQGRGFEITDFPKASIGPRRRGPGRGVFTPGGGPLQAKILI